MTDKTPLTEVELMAVRKIIESDKRRVWLMGNIRASASWVVIVVGGLVLGFTSLKDAIRALVGVD